MPDTDYRHIIHNPTMEPTIVPLLTFHAQNFDMTTVLDSLCLVSAPDAYLSEFVACPKGVYMTPSLHSTANDTQHRGRTGNKSLNNN